MRPKTISIFTSFNEPSSFLLFSTVRHCPKESFTSKTGTPYVLSISTELLRAVAAKEWSSVMLQTYLQNAVGSILHVQQENAQVLQNNAGMLQENARIQEQYFVMQEEHSRIIIALVDAHQQSCAEQRQTYVKVNNLQQEILRLKGDFATVKANSEAAQARFDAQQAKKAKSANRKKQEKRGWIHREEF